MNHPFNKPMREWDIAVDVDAAIDWNAKRNRRECGAMKRALGIALCLLLYGGVICFVAWMMISYPIDH